jgi:hypothetical protein
LIARLPSLALDVVLLALGAGAARAKWIPVAVFLGLAAVAHGYFWIGKRLERRRASRLRQAEVPFGIRLETPFWLALGQASFLIFFGGAFGAIATALGFLGVGVGILAIFVGLTALLVFSGFEASPRALTFEADRLRLHIRRASLVVPWTAITGLERFGPDHASKLRLRFDAADVVVDLPDPKDVRARASLEALARGKDGAAPEITLDAWIAGLDAPTIARTIESAMARDADSAT